MSIFPPADLCLDARATGLWLGGVMGGLIVMGIALLVQAGILWQRVTQVRIVWWRQLPLVLPLGWAGVCAFDAVQVFMAYRGMWREYAQLHACPPGVRCGMPLYCYPAVLGGPAQIALIGAACLLMLGWLALSAFARRIRAA